MGTRSLCTLLAVVGLSTLVFAQPPLEQNAVRFSCTTFFVGVNSAGEALSAGPCDGQLIGSVQSRIPLTSIFNTGPTVHFVEHGTFTDGKGSFEWETRGVLTVAAIKQFLGHALATGRLDQELFDSRDLARLGKKTGAAEHLEFLESVVVTDGTGAYAGWAGRRGDVEGTLSDLEFIPGVTHAVEHIVICRDHKPARARGAPCG